MSTEIGGKKVVAYFSSQYPLVSTRFIYDEVRGLRAKGWEVHTISVNPFDPSHELEPEEAAESATTRYIKPLDVAKLIVLAKAILASPATFATIAYHAIFTLRPFHWKSIAHAAQSLILREYMRELGVTHMHVHFANAGATVAMLACTPGDLEFSLSVHGPDTLLQPTRYHLVQKLERARWIRSISSHCTDRIASLLPACRERVRRVHMGVDLAKLMRARPYDVELPLRMLTVGRLVPQKGHFDLLHAAGKLARRRQDFSIDVVGDGPIRDELLALRDQLGLRQLVRYHGGCGHHVVRAMLDRAHLFLLPSLHEGLPVALVEAMAKGVPCLSTRIDGIPELIEDGVDGLLVEPGDVGKLAATLEDILDDPHRLLELSKRTRDKVAHAFDLDRTTEAMSAALAPMIARAPDGRPLRSAAPTPDRG